MSTAGAAASVPFDARPLVEPVDRAAVREFTKRLRAEGLAPAFASASGSSIAIIAVAGVFVVGFGGMFLSIITTLLASSGGEFALPVLLPIVLVVGLLAAGAAFAIRAYLGGSPTWYRLDRFARANGMTFRPVVANPPLPGMIFGVGGSRAASNIVRGDEPRFVEFANYTYTTGSGKNRSTHKWGYVAVHLDVLLPHIVLDAIGNNGLFGASNLPIGFDRDQKLSLEGDFDRYFSLFCPAGYERDALYLFTPDIMARFIDNAAALDVEIVDDWLFLYAKRDFATLDPSTWAWLFSVVAALLDKLAQWERWRDERLAQPPIAVDPVAAHQVGATDAADPPPATALPFAAPTVSLRPPPGVAPPGRRLRRGISWVSIVFAVVIVGAWLLQIVGGIFLSR